MHTKLFDDDLILISVRVSEWVRVGEREWESFWERKRILYFDSVFEQDIEEKRKQERKEKEKKGRSWGEEESDWMGETSTEFITMDSILSTPPSLTLSLSLSSSISF